MNISSNKVGQLVGKAFASYRNEVLSVFLQYGISMEDAEDLTQNVFLKLLGVDIVHEESLKALVMVTALNLRKDYCRRLGHAERRLHIINDKLTKICHLYILLRNSQFMLSIAASPSRSS